MIAKFNTPKISVAPITTPTSKSGGGSGMKTFLTIIALGGIGYLGYKYWWLPKQEKEKLNKNG